MHIVSLQSDGLHFGTHSHCKHHNGLFAKRWVFALHGFVTDHRMSHFSWCWWQWLFLRNYDGTLFSSSNPGEQAHLVSHCICPCKIHKWRQKFLLEGLLVWRWCRKTKSVRLRSTIHLPHCHVDKRQIPLPHAIQSTPAHHCKSDWTHQLLVQFRSTRCWLGYVYPANPLIWTKAYFRPRNHWQPVEADFVHNKYWIDGSQNIIGTWPNNNRV